VTTSAWSDSSATSKDVDDGQSAERRSAVPGSEGIFERHVCASGRSAVRDRDIDGSPVDRESQDWRADGAPQGWRRVSTLDPHDTFIVGMLEEQKDITLDEMVSRLMRRQMSGSVAAP